MKPSYKIHNSIAKDEVLITAAVSGNKKALEQLIKKYQNYIYNVSLRLFLNPDDALDATQEVLIKVITSLKTFRGQSQFSTWLYRIAFNHFLSMPQRPTEKLLQLQPEGYAGFLDQEDTDVINEEAIEEVRLLCSNAMLMCLNREQRLIYITGEIFGADHKQGASLFDLTPANYRVKLHRAKADLLNFVSGKCGIINPGNPCRCPKKAKLLISKGLVDKESLKFNIHFTLKVNAIVAAQKNEVSNKINSLKYLFQDSPFQIIDELDQILNDIVQ
jgi:RNA polymerase sigma factor (sigma-70 family)